MEEDIQAAGRVRLFQFQQRANQKRPQELERPKEQAVEEILVISGTQEFGGLGSSLAWSRLNYLWLKLSFRYFSIKLHNCESCNG